MSYMILPINLVKQFDHYNLNMIPDFSTIHALTLNLMIKEGYYEKYVKRCIKYMERNEKHSSHIYPIPLQIIFESKIREQVYILL